ncbi:hypothetical protein [Halobacteriovorax sp. ZH4_bin.1]|uniref:hypothetical protein n=1 Tax=unclassified Halobacteriovorax TaxID=2639665 RepID=UPI00371744E6
MVKINILFILILFSFNSFAKDYSLVERSAIDKKAMIFLKENNFQGFPFKKTQLVLELVKPSKENKNVRQIPRFKLYHDKEFKKVALRFVDWKKGDSPQNHSDMTKCSELGAYVDTADQYIEFLGKYKKTICVRRRKPETKETLYTLGYDMLFYDYYPEKFSFYINHGRTILVDELTEKYAVINIEGQSYYLNVAEVSIEFVRPPTSEALKTIYGNKLLEAENKLYEFREILLSRDRKIFENYLSSDGTIIILNQTKINMEDYLRNALVKSVFDSAKLIRDQSLAIMLYLTYYEAYNVGIDIKWNKDAYKLDEKQRDMIGSKFSFFIDADYLSYYDKWSPFKDVKVGNEFVGYRLFGNKDQLRYSTPSLIILGDGKKVTDIELKW